MGNELIFAYGSFPLVWPIGIRKTLHSFANGLISITKHRWEKGV